MHARSVTIMARPDLIDAGVAFVRDEVMQTMMAMDGWIGLSMLVDRTSGRCITTSAWQDEDSMRAAGEQLRPLRRRGAELMGGGEPQAEEWEITVLHRDHTSQQGACVRATWVRMDPQQVDRGVDIFKSSALPAIEGYDGFCSASLLVNRENGRAVVSVTFDSRDAMERNRERAQQVREQAVREMNGEVLEVGEFELTLAHLRVPELV
jgi:heme-degrading monooxygenase HmoA